MSWPRLQWLGSRLRQGGMRLVAAAVLAVLATFAVASSCEPLVVHNEEHEPPGEKELIDRAVNDATEVSKRESGHDRLHKRDAHAPPQGCVRAHFEVRPDIEPGFRHGVLATPGRKYPAWVRFSNATKTDDTLPDARGMAIKLMGVEGKKLLSDEADEPTQDFVMINHHTFLAADVKDYLEFFRYQSEGDDFGYFIGFKPWRWHLRELKIGLELLLQDIASPLDASYYSMVPFKLGPEQNIKFSAKPCDPEIVERCELLEPEDDSVERGPHYLRAALVKALLFDEGTGVDAPRRPAARFLFQVQVQKPGHRMPIEDATIRWNEEEAAAPFQPVADLTIEYQRFDSEEQNRFCENLSFNPWHALPAHEPIGGLNRARRRVYEAVSKFRHQGNGVARHEPRGFCLRLDGQPCEPSVEVAKYVE